MAEGTKEEILPIKALFIGINKYIACDPLNYAVNDATAAKDLFGRINMNIYSILLTDSLEPRFQPIRSNILSNIKLIADNAKGNENLLFFFAGHGKDINGEPVILPSDYRDELGMETAVKIEDIKNTLSKSSARFKLIILDSCHSGAVQGRAESGTMTEAFLNLIEQPPKGFAIVSACNLNQVSMEDPNLKHGVFTHFLLEGIDGKADTNNDKVITINELYDYITPKVKDWVFEKYNASQIPHLRANFDGIYVLNRLPVETPKSEDLMRSELFTKIWLWQSRHEMDLAQYNASGIDPNISDAIESAVSDIILTLRKEYGLGGFVDNGNTVDFKDGAILRQSHESEKEDLEIFRTCVFFNYLKERQSIIDNQMLNLDDKYRTWNLMALWTACKFKTELLEKLCDEKGYELTNVKLKPKSLTFRGKLFSDDQYSITLNEDEDGSTLYISPEGYPSFFKEHFYTLVNPKTVCELLKGTLLE